MGSEESKKNVSLELYFRFPSESNTLTVTGSLIICPAVTLETEERIWKDPILVLGSTLEALNEFMMEPRVTWNLITSVVAVLMVCQLEPIPLTTSMEFKLAEIKGLLMETTAVPVMKLLAVSMAFLILR